MRVLFFVILFWMAGAYAQSLACATRAISVCPPAEPVFTANIVEYKSSKARLTPTYPGDRFVRAPWLAIFHVNDKSTNHTNSIYATLSFPSRTEFVTNYPKDGSTKVRTFTFMDYGNYLDAPATIKPRQLDDITALNQTWDFGFIKTSGAANLTLDWFVFSSSAGTTSTIAKEIQIYTDPAPSTVTGFLNHLPVVGSYTSAAIGSTPSETWKVTYQASNVQGRPYYQFRMVDGDGRTQTLHAGTFDLHAAMKWLKKQVVPGHTESHCLQGSEWFTGFGDGYELLNGTVTLNVNAITTAYAPA